MDVMMDTDVRVDETEDIPPDRPLDPLLSDANPANDMKGETLDTSAILQDFTKDIMPDIIDLLKAEESTNAADVSVEDVPTDFFDDFNNTEFLAGLDVVDAWEDDNGEVPTKVYKQSKNNTPERAVSESSQHSLKKELPDQNNASASKAQANITDNLLKNNEEPVNKLKKYTIPKRKSRSRDRRLAQDDEREKDVGKEREKVRKYTAEVRRDPAKVRRDIQRDKAKCEKERITEKLRFVETGLVPPGTEMDVPDASGASGVSGASTASKPSAAVSRASHTSNENPREAKLTGRNPAKRRYSRSPSPVFRKRRYSRSRSPVQIVNIRRRYSPPVYRRRTRSRTRSPPKPDYERPERARYEQRYKRVRSRSKSPDRRYQKISSERHSSKQSYDRSPEGRKQSFLEELDRKLAQKDQDRLKNITAKLNGETLGGSMSHSSMNPHAHSMHHGMMLSNPAMVGMVPVAAPQIMPVPAPQMVPAPYVYDQSFFVGSAHMADPNPYNVVGYPQSSLSYDHFQHNTQMYHADQSAESTEESNRKLFNDDSISLSEYLKLTQRSDNAQQIKISHKVKVLNRCHDALKLMSGLQHPNGRFYCTISRQLKKKELEEEPSECDSTSPLRESSVCINYTSKRTGNEKQSTALNRLMARLDIKKKTVILPPSALPAQTFEDASSQTDEYECDNCEARRRIQHADVGIQCTPETLEFSAQVTEDDFLSTARNALKNLLKQQSFASLTPAQILAQLGENKEQEKPKADFEERMERHTDYDRRPATQDFERRERPADFDRRGEQWGQRQYSQSPQKPQRCSDRPEYPRFNDPRGSLGAQTNPQSGYSPRGMGSGPRPGGPRPGPGPRPQNNMGPNPRPPGMNHLGGGPPMARGNAGPGPGQRPGFRPGFQNPPGFGNQFGPNTMGNYPMRRFN